MRNADGNKFNFIDDVNFLNNNSNEEKNSAESDKSLNKNNYKKDTESKGISENNHKNSTKKQKRDAKKKKNSGDFSRDNDKIGDRKNNKNRKNNNLNNKNKRHGNNDLDFEKKKITNDLDQKNNYEDNEKKNNREQEINDFLEKYQAKVKNQENNTEAQENHDVSLDEDIDHYEFINDPNDETTLQNNEVEGNESDVVSDEKSNDNELGDDFNENAIQNNEVVSAESDVSDEIQSNEANSTELSNDFNEENIISDNEVVSFDNNDLVSDDSKYKESTESFSNTLNYKNGLLRDISDKPGDSDVYEEAQSDKNEEIASFTYSADEKVEDNIVAEKSVADKNVWAEPSNKRHGFHFNFQCRIACLIVGILVLFVSACFMIYNALKINAETKVSYTETANADFDVTLYDGSKYGSGLKYGSDFLDVISVMFSTEAEFQDEVDYDLRYRVVLYNRIYEDGEVIFEDEDIIISKDTAAKDGNVYKYSTSVNLDYQKYNEFVKNYSKYSEESESTIDVVMYVDTPDGSRELSSLSIPIDKDVFEIELNNPKKSTHDVTIVQDEWTNTNTLIVVVGSLLILLSLLLLARLTRLILSTLDRKNKYELTLTKIFSEYDKYLVVARGGYESDVVKNVVKVDSFKELLSVRESLNKPIIYSKINNVKSEFIIDDDDLIYKYVLKEVDIEK